MPYRESWDGAQSGEVARRPRRRVALMWAAVSVFLVGAALAVFVWPDRSAPRHAHGRWQSADGVYVLELRAGGEFCLGLRSDVLRQETTALLVGPYVTDPEGGARSAANLDPPLGVQIVAFEAEPDADDLLVTMTWRDGRVAVVRCHEIGD